MAQYMITPAIDFKGQCEHTLTRQCLRPGVPVEPGHHTHPECTEAAWQRSRAASDERVRTGYWHKRAAAETDDAAEAPERTSGVSDGQRKPGHPRAGEVRTYLLAYDGRFEFLLNMKQIVLGTTKYDKLTDGQVEAVAKCIDREKERTTRPETGRDLRVLPVGTTRAAVENAEGHLTFLKIDNIAPTNERWGGWVFVNQQQGGNDRIKVGSQRPGQTYVGNWPSLIDAVLADPMAAVVRYGRELGVCGVCNTALTNEESREAGIGPVCARRMREAAGEGD